MTFNEWIEENYPQDHVELCLGEGVYCSDTIACMLEDAWEASKKELSE